MKIKISNILIIVLLLLSISCCSSKQENKNRIRFYKEMPHFSTNKEIIWQRDTISYYKVFSEINFYESSNYEEYPYLFVYIDKNKDIHYFFIRRKDIKITKNKIEIEMYDESDMKFSFIKIFTNIEFSFKLNY